MDRGDGGIRVEREVGVAVGELPSGEGVARVLGVHGVRRIAAERGAARAAERLEQLKFRIRRYRLAQTLG